MLEDKKGESNILATSEELMVRSFPKIKEGLHAPFADEEGETIENLEASQIPRIVTSKGTFLIIDTSFEDENDENNLPLSWKIKRSMVLISSNGKEKVVGETERRK